MEPQTKTKITPKKLNLDEIKAIKILGKGAMGTVFLAHHISSPHSPFALKVIHKPYHDNHDLDRRANWELSLLSSFPSHPFLPTFLGSFDHATATHPNDLVGWAMPFCSGGDLNTLRYQQTDHVFSTSAIRFYLAEIICALAHLHSMGIAYRDLKPENVLVQSSGHVTLTDFDLSTRLTGGNNVTYNTPNIKNSNNDGSYRRLTRIFSLGSVQVSPLIQKRSSFSEGRRSYSFVGTEEYISPEVVKREGHAYVVDWWALGVLAYEMLYGKTPFKGRNKKETFRNVVLKKPEFVGNRTALIDLIQRLLEKDPVKRLGYCRGAEEIKEHEFFKGLKWDLLTEVLRPPFVPSTEDLTENVPPFDIREYYEKQKGSALSPSSPLSCVSSVSDDEVNV